MFRYRLLMWLLSPALAGYTAWVALRHRDARYFWQRLGVVGRAAQGEQRPVWVHAASVGEVSAVAPLVRRLAERCAPRPVVITTVTPTGAAIARERLGGCAAHRFLPLDWPGAVRRFVRRVRPACLLVMETELWPNLYRACARAEVPIVLVNGRLTRRSLRENRWWRSVQAQTLGRVRAVLARTAADAETFMSLGMEAGRVRVLGNLKFAVAGDPPTPLALGRPYALAASTREGEERLIVEQWRKVSHGGRLLVLAPRHPGRLADILTDLAPLGVRVAVRSRGQAITAETDVYVADTLGELGAFMAGADLVIMGGSFVPVGGHNILEPARLGKAVVFGPHMQNFAEEAELLCGNEAAVQLGSAAELADCLNEFLARPEKAAALGRNAARLIATRAGVLDDYLAALGELCPELALSS
ncbi:MAG TPA: 3-deoxy-D-manno-octulosonic acid transferase [Burkholderiales bacterium]